MASASIGSLVHVPHLKIEGIVSSMLTERGVRVEIDGPETHELCGASMWVSPTDIHPLKAPKKLPGHVVGGNARAKTADGSVVDVKVLDVRKSAVRRGPNGIRVQVRAAEETFWVAAKDIIEPCSGSEDEAPAAKLEIVDAAAVHHEEAVEAADDEEAAAEPDDEEAEEEAADDEAAVAAADEVVDDNGGVTEEDEKDNNDGDDDGETSSSGEDEDAWENEAVVVTWGTKAKRREHNAVVVDYNETRMYIQFDCDRAHAWVPRASVRRMEEADDDDDAPEWAKEGKEVEALDLIGRGWHAAKVSEVRMGVREGRGDDGLRVCVTYDRSGLTQWLRRNEVRLPGSDTEAPTPPPPKAAERTKKTKQPRGESSGDNAAAKRRKASTAAAAPSSTPPPRTNWRPQRSQHSGETVRTRALEEEAEEEAEDEGVADEEEEAEDNREEEEGSSSDDDDDGDLIEEGEAVIVVWGTKSKRREYNATVIEIKASRIKVQFDCDRAMAWVPSASVRVMPQFGSNQLPAFLSGNEEVIPADGKDIEALDPFNNNPNKWHPATVEESRKGVTEEGSDEGDDSDLRFWVRYKVSGLCQWLNAREVRAVSTTEAAAAAPPPPLPPASGDTSAASGSSSSSSHNSTISKLQVVNLSRRSGRAGDELWLLLSSDALDEKVHTPIVHFGQMEAEGARRLAPNLVACTVPDGATEGVTGVRLSVAPGGAVSPGCSMRFEVLQ